MDPVALTDHGLIQLVNGYTLHGSSDVILILQHATDHSVTQQNIYPSLVHWPIQHIKNIVFRKISIVYWALSLEIKAKRALKYQTKVVVIVWHGTRSVTMSWWSLSISQGPVACWTLLFDSCIACRDMNKLHAQGWQNYTCNVLCVTDLYRFGCLIFTAPTSFPGIILPCRNVTSFVNWLA